MNPLIITHANCVDGCCSQAILRAKYNYNANYMELDHVNLDEKKDPNARNFIEKITSQRDSDVYIADFCLPSNLIESLLLNNNKVTVLDHHIDNLKHLAPLQNKIKNGENLNLNISFSLDNTQSGALLTWKYIFPNVEVPLAIKHVSAGDVWKFEFGDSTKHFYAGLLKNFEEPKNIPNNFWQEIIFNETIANNIINIGKPIHEKFMNEVHQFSLIAQNVILDNKQGLIVKAPKKYTSDLGNYLCRQGADFGLVYFIEDSGIVRCSLRAIEPNTVNNIAQKFGGGGHPQAAAFRCANMQEFQKLLQEEGNSLSLNIEQNKLKL